MAKYRVRFEIDEEVEAENKQDAIELAISATCGGYWFDNELTEHIKNYGDVEEIEEEIEEDE